MKNHGMNPYLPSWEYVPDGEPHVFGKRVYIYGSHDRFAGYAFCQNDYVCWSAPVDDLTDWQYEGIIYTRAEAAHNEDGRQCLYAPDAVSDSPCRSFVYGGTLVDNADLGLCDTARYFTGNNHGSIEQINGRWYVFYHRHTNSSMFCRQGMVEPIEILPDGRIPQVEITTSGPSGAPLPAVELRELPAYAACNLYMTQPPQVNAEAGQNPFPYITQDGADVMPESESKPEAYICNLTPGTVVGFKYLNFQNVTKVSVKTRGMCYYGGFDVLLTADGEPIGTVSAARGNEWTWQTTELAIPNGISAIYFRMKGYGTLSLAAAKFH